MSNAKRRLEKTFEKAMYSTRWLLAPIYIGLSLCLIALGFKFFQEAFHMLLHMYTLKETDLVLITLSLIDIAMVGGLLIMVMMSGYENFVSRMTVNDHEKLDWLGTMDAASLKAKIAASIIAISSIHLLKAFMSAETLSDRTLFWYVVIHMTFVVSAFMMGYLDHIIKKSKKYP